MLLNCGFGRILIWPVFQTSLIFIFLIYKIRTSDIITKVLIRGLNTFLFKTMSFPGGSVVKNPPANAEDSGSIPGLNFLLPLEEEMAPHSSILARKIPWTEEPGGLQSMGSQKGRM